MAQTEVSTPDTGPAPEPENASTILDGILETAINAGESRDSGARSTPKQTPPVGANEAEEVEVHADPSDDTAEGDVTEAELGHEGEPEAGDASEPKHISAPKTWPTEHREAFDELPEQLQIHTLKREKEREAAFTRKTTELAEQRKEAKGVLDVVKPYEAQMRANGIQPAEYLARLMTYDNALRQNPKQTLEYLAQHYGVNLGSGDTGVEQQPVYQEPADPQYQQLQQQLNQTQEHLRSMEQTQQQERYGQLVGTVETFAKEKDSAGNPKYPHFDKLRERMGRLVNSGETTDLGKAYNMALRMDDGLYKQVIESARSAVSRKEDDRRKAAVEKAKRAKPASSGAPPRGSVKQSDLDGILRDSIQGVGI